MAGLTDFEAFVLGRCRVVEKIEQRLCAIQEHYEDFYAEVTRVKEGELDQLEELVHRRRDSLPDWLADALDKERPAVEKELDERTEALRAQAAEVRQAAEAGRLKSSQEEREIHARNQSLDDKEEALKARNEELLKRIAGYNARIREMSSGFGFFSNLMLVRRMRTERQELDREQADVAAHIDLLRSKWASAEAVFVKTEEERQSAWVAARSATAEVETRLQWLEDSRERVLYRTTLQRAIGRHPGVELKSGRDDQPCPRCEYANPREAHLCQVCGNRLLDDDPGLEGSLTEIAEAVRIHETFTEGMAACQGIIGLMRGLKSGHDAFVSSVQDMLDTQNRYPVSVLEIDVPGKAVAYGAIFDEVLQTLPEGKHRHPVVFAEEVEQLLAGRLGEEAIQTYFETMGEELTRCADAQW